MSTTTGAIWDTSNGAIDPESLLKRLKALPPEIVSKNGGIVRQVLFQVAKVPEVKAKEIAPHDTGRLQKAIRKKRDRNPHFEGATENYQVYVYPGKNRDDERGAWYWTFVHFKTKKNPDAVPFLTIAFESTQDEMIQVFKATFKNKMKLVEKKIQQIK